MARMTKADKVEKKAQIAEWVSKGGEWCAEKLWIYRERHKDDLERQHRLEQESQEFRWKNQHGFDMLKRINENMAEVMSKAGLRPVPLRITYMLRDCDGCRYERYADLDCDGDLESFEHCYASREVILNDTFYSYKVDGDWLEAINSKFEKGDYELLKLVDDRTGEVIYEAEKGKE